MSEGSFGKIEIAPIPEAREAKSPKEIAAYFEFADPILQVDWGEDGAPEDYTADYISNHPDETCVFTIREQDEIVAGSKVTRLNEETKIRLGLDAGVFAEREGALLEYTVVREDHRNKRVLSVLTDKRIEWARQHDAAYVCTEIEITNPISAHTKTRDGFFFVGVRGPEAGIPSPYLIAVKSISKDFSFHEEDSSDQFETKKIVVTEESQEELDLLFKEGWIGVDAQCEADTGPWTLVFRRAKEK